MIRDIDSKLVQRRRQTCDGCIEACEQARDNAHYDGVGDRFVHMVDVPAETPAAVPARKRWCISRKLVTPPDAIRLMPAPISTLGPSGPNEQPLSTFNKIVILSSLYQREMRILTRLT